VTPQKSSLTPSSSLFSHQASLVAEGVNPHPFRSERELDSFLQAAETICAERVAQRKKSKQGLKRRLFEMRHTRESGADPRFTHGVYSLDKLTNDLKPALVLHLYPSHFTFDGLPGSYTYDGFMRNFLEAIDEQRIPAEVADLFDDQAPFYDGCLVVELRNYQMGQVETRWVLLRPTLETILGDVYQLAKNQCKDISLFFFLFFFFLRFTSSLTRRKQPVILSFFFFFFFSSLRDSKPLGTRTPGSKWNGRLLWPPLGLSVSTPV